MSAADAALLRRLIVGRKALIGLLWHEVCASCTAFAPDAADPTEGACVWHSRGTQAEAACTSYEARQPGQPSLVELWAA